ncbi:MAG: hypothetical protein AB8D78_01095 [Akkermansiaceae bacterium]
MNQSSVLLGLICLIFSSCGASVGIGSGGVENLASTRVKTNSSSAVERAVLDVFQDQGFSVISKGSQSVSFSKRGGRSADIAWSTMNNPNPVMIRPTVGWRASSEGEMLVTCQVEVAQQSTVYGETVRQPLMVGKAAYNGMLKDVKRRVERSR